jgi:uncharacterized protein (DUF3820 family)
MGSVRKRARLDSLYMPIGKFRDWPIRYLPRHSPEYANWIVAQPWFRQRYPDEALALARAIKLWSDPETRRQAEEEDQRASEARQAEQRARFERQEQRWLDDHKVDYATRGIMPFGKHRGRPLAAVARDEYYCRWFFGSTYSRVNPELASDLKLVMEQLKSGKPALKSIELHDGGCVVYRPTIWGWSQQRETNETQ